MSTESPWSDSPYAPQVPYWEYFVEKALFSGTCLGAISYGIAIILFFQCMGALLDPINRTRGGIKWGLVAHSTAMFSVLTVDAALSLAIYPISYVDNRDFTGGPDDTGIPGPYGYQWFTYFDAISVAPNVLFFFNTCLADGFLLYRCFVIYSKNYLVMIIPCLMFLTSVALSIVISYSQISTSGSIDWDFVVGHLEVPYFSISLSLNILITLMIAARLIRHSRNIRSAIGRTSDNGLYNTVVTMLVESCVLYAVGSLLFLGPLGAKSPIQGIFAPSFGNVQVIASYLIILRVANRTALTSDVITPAKIGSIRFQSPGETTGGNTDGDPASSMETDPDGDNLRELSPRPTSDHSDYAQIQRGEIISRDSNLPVCAKNKF